MKKEECKEYLLILHSNKTSTGYTINIRNEVIENELKHRGWMVLLSNYIAEAKERITSDFS